MLKKKLVKITKDLTKITTNSSTAPERLFVLTTDDFYNLLILSIKSVSQQDISVEKQQTESQTVNPKNDVENDKGKMQ